MNDDSRANASEDWQAWRRRMRRHYLDVRRGLADDVHQQHNQAIDTALGAGFVALGGLTIGFCWPFGGEPDARFAVRRWREAGSTAALPVVTAPRTPLVFRQWWPGAPMAKGVYDIPYPVDTPEQTPQAALVPVVGFDGQGYRLGYGGGFFDRTLASLATQPVTIGLAYEVVRMESIQPQSHDVPFDFIVTESGIHARTEDGLRSVTPSEADEQVRTLIDARRLHAAD